MSGLGKRDVPKRLGRALARRLGRKRIGTARSERPAHWAQPLAIDGVRNLHRVTLQLYRSAQPAPRGMAALRALGIRSIVNLRAFHCDLPRIAGTGLGHHRLHLLTWQIEDAHVVRVLGILREPRNAPVLIHCQHGADRTGLMVAMYRMVEQGWSREDAIREMVEGGFGYHRLWHSILRYLEAVDVERIRGELDRRHPPARTA